MPLPTDGGAGLCGCRRAAKMFGPPADELHSCFNSWLVNSDLTDLNLDQPRFPTCLSIPGSSAAVINTMLFSTDKRALRNNPIHPKTRSRIQFKDFHLKYQRSSYTSQYDELYG